ncbi:MAG: fatty acid kinase [Pseudonocardiales bacterium]|nr:fatty acid kinase [Pseudonocardiales bacterium]
MLDALDASAIRRWSGAALASVRVHQDEIDALNVFPVPDGDTGTNLALTLAAADDALAAEPADVDAAGAARALARGAVRGARGNSGVILSQLLRGLADASAGRFAPKGSDGEHGADGAAGAAGRVITGAVLCRALRLGADHAWRAVAEPADGTLLTVARAVADALPDPASEGDRLPDCVQAAVTAARVALARTTGQHPVLAEAGVVDAGAKGYVLVLEALLDVVTGTGGPADTPGTTRAIGTGAIGASASLTEPLGAAPSPRPAHRETGSPEFGYEVQYLLDIEPGAEPAELRGALAVIGDSVTLAGTGDGLWNVHVHTNDVGAAVEAGVHAGRPYRISVLRFTDQQAPGAVAVVAVAPGAGLGPLFAREGVQVVDGLDPAADDVVAVARSTHAAEVVLVPIGAPALAAADEAVRVVRRDGVRAAVVPTRSAVQALAAIAVHDGNRSFDDDVVAMAEAAAATRFAEVVVADQQALTSVGMCEPGDILGLIDGEVVEIGHGLLAVTFALTDRLLGVGAELLTVLVGEGAPNGVGAVIAGHVRNRAPLAEVTVYAAGQQSCPLIIGVE